MTCIGNSGPLPEEVGEAIEKVGAFTKVANFCFTMKQILKGKRMKVFYGYAMEMFFFFLSSLHVFLPICLS